MHRVTSRVLASLRSESSVRGGLIATQSGFTRTHRVRSQNALILQRSQLRHRVAWVGGDPVRICTRARDARIVGFVVADSAGTHGAVSLAEDEHSLGESPVHDLWGDRCSAVRDAIRAHLTRFPFAGDTQEGIAANWLPELRYDDSLAIIEQALADMLRDGELVRSALPGGEFFYARGPCFVES